VYTLYENGGTGGKEESCNGWLCVCVCVCEFERVCANMRERERERERRAIYWGVIHA
jgi:hypothetical protein